MGDTALEMVCMVVQIPTAVEAEVVVSMEVPTAAPISMEALLMAVVVVEGEE